MHPGDKLTFGDMYLDCFMNAHRYTFGLHVCSYTTNLLFTSHMLPSQLLITHALPSQVLCCHVLDNCPLIF